MFNVIVSKTQLIDAINKLEPGILGIRATVTGLELRAAYIKEVCRLVAAHIEECAEDADASVHHKIDARDALIIADIGGVLAGQIENAAELEVA